MLVDNNESFIEFILANVYIVIKKEKAASLATLTTRLPGFNGPGETSAEHLLGKNLN